MMKILKTIFLLILLSAMTLNLQAKEASAAFIAGIHAVENKDYPTAQATLEAAIEQDPANSEYRHWLGRVYGLQAQESSWFKAMSLAKKARINFEKSVELDPENIAALLDLREFYNQAPEFLGGSEDKADEITQQLEKLGYETAEEE